VTLTLFVVWLDESCNHHEQGDHKYLPCNILSANTISIGLFYRLGWVHTKGIESIFLAIYSVPTLFQLGCFTGSVGSIPRGSKVSSLQYTQCQHYFNWVVLQHKYSIRLERFWCIDLFYCINISIVLGPLDIFFIKDNMPESLCIM